MCGPSCPDECSPILCPANALCKPACGGAPCNFGCICEPDCPDTLRNPLCGGTGECTVGLPFVADAQTEKQAASEAAVVPIITPISLMASAGELPRSKLVDDRIWGFADLHDHQFAHLAFGGLFLAGEPFAPDMRPAEGIGYALHCCGSNPTVPCGGIECVSNGLDNHGLCGCGDLVGAAMGEFACHHVGGYPEFEGWPRWYTKSHQQVYFEWLERAWRGGLRVMVMLAVNSEALCGLVSTIYPCEDMPAVDRQLQAAKDLERYIDLWDDGNAGNQSGWYRIAYTAQEARAIAAEGKLAVVLGIEVAGLFGCRENSDCAPEHVQRELQRYYAMGVRQITPIHVLDNAFGGAALYNEFFNAGNYAINDRYFDVRDCSGEGYEFRFQGSPLLTLFAGYSPPEYPPAPAAHCNRKALTDAGQDLILQMMNKGMMIDVDHMSARTKDAVLSLAEGRCYPVVSSHCGLTDISSGQKNHEGQMSKDHVRRLRALGGIIAPITHQGDSCSTPGDHREEGCIRQYGETVKNNCSNSSRTWAQAYLYASEAAGGGAVALGTDFNGGAGQPSPRYGPEACDGEQLSQSEADAVKYPFALHGLPGSMEPCITGYRTFNINCDGLAHVGMLPDFIADLKKVGVDDPRLEPLFGSAESYISMWERIEAQSNPRITLADYRQMSKCLRGPRVAAGNCECAPSDLDRDGDVDLEDFAGLQTGLWSPRQP